MKIGGQLAQIVGDIMRLEPLCGGGDHFGVAGQTDKQCQRLGFV